MMDFESWLRPEPVSQVAGALISAFIAIGLWRAESNKLELERKNEEIKKINNFRSTIKIALIRLQREIEKFKLQAKSKNIEISRKIEIEQIENKESTTSIQRDIRGISIRSSKILDISDNYALYLNNDQVIKIVELLDLLDEINMEINNISNENDTNIDIYLIKETLIDCINKCARIEHHISDTSRMIEENRA